MRCTMLPQESFLFSGNIRDNITKGFPTATDEEIVAPAKLSGLHDFVIDYPDGYATDIGESGRTLSGGLRQRISITRALLGDPPIIFLDEPSSNLDREGEQELVATLKTLAVDHTAIVISHSPALLSACDQVLVMQRGRVVRSGRPEDVLPPQLLVGSGMAQLAIPPSLIPARDQTRGCSGGFRGSFYTDWSRRAKKSK